MRNFEKKFLFVVFVVSILNWMLAVEVFKQYPRFKFNLTNIKGHSSSSIIPTLLGLNILIAIPSLNISHFLHVQDMLGSLRDLCECGANVSVVLYLNYSSPDVDMTLQSRIHCRHPSGNLQLNLVPHPAALELHFVDEHKRYFYDHLDDFDLFVYAEDDMHVRPTHIVSYLQETYKLVDLLGNKALQYYCIGFLRYEREWEINQYLIYEQYLGGSAFPIPDSDPHSKVINKKYFTVSNIHQAMYMATREQLKIWKSKCQFDKADDGNVLHREHVSSFKLFSNGENNCRIRKLIPVHMTDDFLIHHMPDKNHLIRDRSTAFTSLELKKEIDYIILEDNLHL